MITTINLNKNHENAYFYKGLCESNLTKYE